MLSKTALRSVLKGRIYQNQLTVSKNPTARRKGFYPFEDCGLTAREVKTEDREWIKHYAVNKFYRIGNIPAALKMAETFRKHPLLEQELDMMLDSGACQKIMDATDDSLAALCLNCVWETDPNYDAFPVHGADWLNVASDLARQEGVTDSNSMAIWRDFLYQWLYHKFQQQSQRSNCDFVFYFAVQYTEPGFRNGNLARKMMSYYIDETTRQNGYFGIMGTFNKYQQFMMEPLKHKVQLLEYVPYKSLQFKLGGEENIFGKLANEDGDGMRVTGSRGVRPS